MASKHHEHHHHHHHTLVMPANNTAFLIGIVLNAAYVAVQVVMGIVSHSMAMLADAGHNTSDVASLALSMFAINWAKKKSNKTFTYGYKKTTILAALTNAVVLLLTIGFLGFESVKRLLHPEVVQGKQVAIVAAIGIIINFGSALLFFKDKEHDLNTKSAFLHLFTDGLMSLAVVVSGIAITITHWYWLDGAVSIILLLVILWGTWHLLTGSLRMSLDGVPQNIDFDHIQNIVLSVPGVVSLHHVHIWAMSTTENAMTAHVLMKEELTFKEKMEVVHEIKHELFHEHVHHCTIEIELPDNCSDMIY
jgi:cobalt-zinc-cadmium efflux system protein